MFGNVTALVGLHVTGKYRDEKHAAHMLQECGLGSSHSCFPCAEMGMTLPSVDLGPGRTVVAFCAGGHHACALLVRLL